MSNAGCPESVPEVQCPALILFNSVLFLLPQTSRMSRSFCTLWGSFSALMSSYSQQILLVQPKKMPLPFPCCLSQPNRVLIAFSPFLNLITTRAALLKLLPST